MACGARTLFIFLGVLAFSNAFNLDTNVPIVKEGRTDSYFGFSVTQHQVYRRRTGTTDHVMLVGAPRDNVTDPSAPSQVRNINSPGVIYTCPVSSFTDDCESIDIDREIPRKGEVKDGQWLGVSVQSQGTEEGKAVACAHRFRMSGPGYDHGPGLCIVMSNELDEDDFLEPCSGKPKVEGHGQYGLCQAGTSLAVSDDGDVLIGTPGPYNWRGSVFKNIIRESLTETRKWYQSPVEDPLDEDDRPKPATGYYSYLGMSSKIGNILGHKTYVTGAPRSNKAGEVLLFSQGSDMLTIKPENRILGQQFGSGFGYDIAVIDLNADKKDDLVVGAPFLHKAGKGGAVYVYINGPKGINKDTKPIVIESRMMKPSECRALDCTNARFGAAVANIGDIDLDGFQDLAVGAPFEGSGAVYIFRGTAKGIRTPHSQRIAASDLLSARPLASFGASISGGVDMDDNGYPDVVVGAYDTNKALVLRSRPVINIETIIQNYPEKINPSETVCAQDGRKQICFNLRVCFRFSAMPLDRFTGKIDVDYKLEIEPEKIKPRASFKGSLPGQPHIIEKSMKLHEQSSSDFKCREHQVYIDKNNKDFLNPIFFELTYKLKDEGVPTMSPGQTVPDINNYPVLNEQAAKQDLGVHFVKDCGVDNVCQSNLAVFGNLQLDVDETGVPLLRVGEQDEVRLSIRVKNQGEDAHEAELSVLLPKALPFMNSEPRIGCDFKVLEDDELYNLVTCPVGNPMKTNQETRVVFRLDANKITAVQRIVDIHLRVNTTSTEADEANNLDVLSVRVLIETDMVVRGQSHPTNVFYGGDVLGESAIEYEDQIGPMVVHSYEIVNYGPGAVSASTVLIHWPYEVENGYDQGKHLLYLMEEPTIAYPGKCDVDPSMINPLRVQLNDTSILDHISTLHKIQKVVDSRKDDNIDQVLPVLSSDNGQNPEYSSTEKRRVKRENVIRSERRMVEGRDQSIVYMDCESGRAKCFTFRCTIGKMDEGQSIAVHMRARLWNHTFVEDYRKVDQVWVSSMAELQIDPDLNIKQLNTENDKDWATTKAQPDIRIREPDGVPIWIIIVSVIGGLILLIVLVILLYKCGFFKRKKPEDMHTAEKKKMYYEDDYS